MNIKRAATNGAYPNRIGGTLDMTSFLNITDSLEGEYSVGLISSQGTMRTPLGRNISATISIRGSYLNLLYGRWLKADNTQIYYQFGDANVSVIHKFSEQDRLLIDFYTGIDNAKFNEANYMAKIKANGETQRGQYIGCMTDKSGAHITAYTYLPIITTSACRWRRLKDACRHI